MGNIISATDRNGRVRQYTYDDLDRQTAEIWLDDSDNEVQTIDYVYDAASQLTSIVDPDSSYSYEYDLAGRLVEVDNAGTTGVTNVVFNYTYDRASNLISVTDTIDGQLSGVESFTYDELNRVIQITQSGDNVADKRVDMSYNAASGMTEMTRYSDLAGTNLVALSNYTYDEAGRLIDLTHSDAAAAIIAAYNWVFDEANRIVQFTNPDGVTDYAYDGRDQLVDADHSYQEDEEYTYDENGNRTNAGYVTGGNNQLLRDGVYNYEYDAEGNRVKQTAIATGEVTSYEWDHRNRLVGVVVTSSTGEVVKRVEYTYDALDRRIAFEVDADGDGSAPAEVERFVYDGEHIALVFDGEGNQTYRYLHGVEVDQVIAQEDAAGEVLWALSDNQGSVRDVVDRDGNVVNHVVYDSFGRVVEESDGGVEFRFGYTGREFDEETGLYYYRARYYDPTNGRFISYDPISFGGGDVNLYRYVGNSPANYTDPTGRNADEIRNPILDIILLIPSVLWEVGKGIEELLRENPNKPSNPTEDIPTSPPTEDAPILEAPTDSSSDDKKPKLEKRPERPKQPRPRPEPQPVPRPRDPKPKDPNKCKETCEKKYPQYNVLSDYQDKQRPFKFPFGGFLFSTPDKAIEEMETHRFFMFEDDSFLIRGNTGPMLNLFTRQLLFLNDLKPGTKKEALHYNVFFEGTEQSAGSVGGKYKFCQEGDPPTPVEASIILNIKDDDGGKFYQTDQLEPIYD